MPKVFAQPFGAQASGWGSYEMKKVILIWVKEMSSPLGKQNGDPKSLKSRMLV